MTHGEGGGGTGAGGECRGVERDDRSVGLVILSQPCSEAIKQAAHAAGESQRDYLKTTSTTLFKNLDFQASNALICLLLILNKS